MQIGDFASSLDLLSLVKEKHSGFSRLLILAVTILTDSGLGNEKVSSFLTKYRDSWLLLFEDKVGLWLSENRNSSIILVKYIKLETQKKIYFIIEK